MVYDWSYSGGAAPSASTNNRFEQIQAVTWIKSHLEEDAGISLPKQEVFEDYKWVHVLSLLSIWVTSPLQYYLKNLNSWNLYS